MEAFNFAIDMDSEKISIYRNSYGIVLSERAMAITHKKTKYEKIIYAGDEAYLMLGKLNDNYKVEYPISNGRIVNLDICAQLINKLLLKVEDKKIIKRRNIVFLVPCGLNKKELEVYTNLGYILSGKNIRLITKAQGVMGLNLTQNKNVSMVANLAHDFLDVAVIYNQQLIKGYTIDFGAKAVSDAIHTYLTERRNIEVDNSTLQLIKDELKTIIPNNNIENVYKGFDVINDDYVKFKISSLEILDYYLKYVGEIADIIEVIIKSCNKEMIAEIKASNLILSGANCEISGLQKFLVNRLGMNVIIPDNPEYSTLLGIGGVLNNMFEINKLSIK